MKATTSCCKITQINLKWRQRQKLAMLRQHTAWSRSLQGHVDDIAEHAGLQIRIFAPDVRIENSNCVITTHVVTVRRTCAVARIRIQSRLSHRKKCYCTARISQGDMVTSDVRVGSLYITMRPAGQRQKSHTLLRCM